MSASTSATIALYTADYAMLPDGLARDVTITVTGGRITAIDAAIHPAIHNGSTHEPGSTATGEALGGLTSRRPKADSQLTDVPSPPDPATTHLPGVVLPGFANAHSHAFHRALRGRTHAGAGDFWTWRREMYEVARTLDPDSYYHLARATYAEMVLAGYTSVGEFHYLHHGRGGVPYDDPNVMGRALVAAAQDAGIRLTLLDTCYLAGGLDGSGHTELDEVQRRFADADVDAWASRVEALEASDSVRIGAAIHSVRAVPAHAFGMVRQVADTIGGGSATPRSHSPLHVHVSEQQAENDACLAYYGATPTALLEEHGVLGPMTTAVHATHVTSEDIDRIGATGTIACFCPTTERDLADGIGPAGGLRGARVRFSLGSDQHAVIDAFEEMRGLECNERLRTQRRGNFSPAALLDAATNHASLGWPDAGRIEVGARADLVAVRTTSVRTSGSSPGQVMFSATAADIDTVIIDGSPHRGERT